MMKRNPLKILKGKMEKKDWWVWWVDPEEGERTVWVGDDVKHSWV